MENTIDDYVVTVCCFGRITIKAESEEQAKEKALACPIEKVEWIGKIQDQAYVLPVYAERKIGFENSS